MSGIGTVVIVAAVMACVLGGITLLAHIYNLNHIKSKTVGDGQHGTARWATRSEIIKTYRQIPFTPQKWREQAMRWETPTVTPLKKGVKEKPVPQGIVVGCRGGKDKTVAMVDTGDVHALMIGAAGVGKTAYWLYPCIEYACASGMSFLSTDTKGDVMRNYGTVARQYGYNVSVIDLRNPTRSNGNNLLHLVNKYMDLYGRTGQLVHKAKAEKYAKIISKTIIFSGMDSAAFGQNAYFYDAAEGILTATILLVAEFCAPQKRHIVSVFKIIQELLAPSNRKGKNQFQQLVDLLPNDHKAKWFVGAALNTAEQSMASVMSTALSRLNAFLDSELEQLLCFDTEIDAEKFCAEKSAVFIIMPEENPNTVFMISLIIQQMYREILAVADENGGKLKNTSETYTITLDRTIPAAQLYADDEAIASGGYTNAEHIRFESAGDCFVKRPGSDKFEEYIYKKSGNPEEEVAYFTEERLYEDISEYAAVGIESFYYWEKEPAAISDGENLYSYSDGKKVLADRGRCGILLYSKKESCRSGRGIKGYDKSGRAMLSRLHIFLNLTLLTRAQSAQSLKGGTCHGGRRM